MLKKIFAFSLSEVLVVVGIIGVVAALTLPNLSHNVEERKCISALRKIYPEIENAYQQVVAEYGRPVEWSAAADASSNKMTDYMNEFIQKYFSIIKNCGRSTKGCFPSYNNVENDTTYSNILLKNGASLSIFVGGMSAIRSNVNNHGTSANDDNFCHGYMGKFIVDVNGPQGENQPGYDIFEFYMCYDEGLVADGDNPAGPTATAASGTAWALKAGNRDYLKCANQLNWNTKRSCK